MEINTEENSFEFIFGDSDKNQNIRELFGCMGRNTPVIYKESHRELGSKRFKPFPDKSNNNRLLAAPKLIMGLGDQIYVDVGYANVNARKNMVWNIGVKLMPKSWITKDFHRDYIHDLYLNHESFSSLNSAFENIPSFGIWDDHEIKDGWGSK